MSATKFIALWFGLLVVIAAVVGGFNYLIDPYSLFGTPRIAHLNATKPANGRKIRLSIPYAMHRYRPEVILAGNSRAEMGLNPRNICFARYNYRVFNLAVPGSSLYMQTRLIEDSIADGSDKLVLYGIYFFDFLLDGRHLRRRPWPPPHESFENRLATTVDGTANPHYRLQYARDHLEALFSLDALWDSIRTVALQGRKEFTTRTDRGFNPSKAYYMNVIHHEGQAVLFQQELRNIFQHLGAHTYALYDGDSQWSERFEMLRHLVDMTKRSGVKLVLFIGPYHAEYLEAIYQSGYGDVFEQWKRMLATIASRNGVELYDFSGYDGYSTVMPPRMGDTKTVLQWFWEPAHYRSRLGDIMLSRMLGGHCADAAVLPQPFGRRLTAASAAADIEALHAGRARFVTGNPALIEHLKALAARYVPRSPQAQVATAGGS